ncbi:MAG: hypothetical protein WAT77_06785 [Paracoccaceae bacterium]
MIRVSLFCFILPKTGATCAMAEAIDKNKAEWPRPCDILILPGDADKQTCPPLQGMQRAQRRLVF